MSETKNIVEARVWTTKQVVMIVVAAITGTFAVSGVFFRFQFLEQEVQTISNRTDTREDRNVLREEEAKDDRLVIRQEISKGDADGKADRLVMWQEINNLKGEHK